MHYMPHIIRLKTVCPVRASWRYMIELRIFNDYKSDKDLTINDQIKLANYWGGKKILTPLVQQHFTMSEVAADWHELMIPWRIMWPSIARDGGQLVSQCCTPHTTGLISHTGSLHHNRALAGPWKSLDFFPDFQGLESPWKQTWSLKVLESVSKGVESAWIWFSKTPWPNQLIVDTEKGVPDGFFLTSYALKIHFRPQTPLGELMTLIYAYKSASLIKFSSPYISFVWSLKVLEFDFDKWTRTLP